MEMLVGDPASFQGRVCPPSQNLSHRIAATEMCYANRKIIEKEGKPYRTFNASPNRASRCHLGFPESRTSYLTKTCLPTANSRPVHYFRQVTKDTIKMRIVASRRCPPSIFRQEPAMTNYVLLFLFGIGVGVLSGLLGIGGGVVLVPGLVLLFGFSQSEAQGTSLAVLSLPILIAAAF